MGHPRRITKKYSTPKHPWRAERIKEESELERRYGLKNKRAIWKAQAYLRDIRRQARKLLALKTEQADVERSQLMGRLIRLGLLKTESNIDDVLVLKSTDILDRRLQSLVYKQGLSATIKQARQLITHGHVRIRGRKVTSPSYLVRAEEEGDIQLVNPVIVAPTRKAKEVAEEAKKGKEVAEEAKKGKEVAEEAKKGKEVAEEAKKGKEVAEEPKKGKKGDEESG